MKVSKEDQVVYIAQRLEIVNGSMERGDNLYHVQSAERMEAAVDAALEQIGEDSGGVTQYMDLEEKLELCLNMLDISEQDVLDAAASAPDPEPEAAPAPAPAPPPESGVDVVSDIISAPVTFEMSNRVSNSASEEVRPPESEQQHTVLTIHAARYGEIYGKMT